MNERQKAIETIRQRLRERRLQLTRYVASLIGEHEDLVDDPAEELRQLDTAGWMMLGPLANEFDHIEAALARIREDSYGNCKECGTTIVAERLELNPFAKRCVICQVSRDVSWRKARGGLGHSQN